MTFKVVLDSKRGQLVSGMGNKKQRNGNSVNLNNTKVAIWQIPLLFQEHFTRPNGKTKRGQLVCGKEIKLDIRNAFLLPCLEIFEVLISKGFALGMDRE